VPTLLVMHPRSQKVRILVTFQLKFCSPSLAPVDWGTRVHGRHVLSQRPYMPPSQSGTPIQLCYSTDIYIDLKQAQAIQFHSMLRTISTLFQDPPRLEESAYQGL